MVKESCLVGSTYQFFVSMGVRSKEAPVSTVIESPGEGNGTLVGPSWKTRKMKDKSSRPWSLLLSRFEMLIDDYSAFGATMYSLLLPSRLVPNLTNDGCLEIH
jgi:hypothetical protein